MVKQSTGPSNRGEGAPLARRLTAEARRGSILEAARRALIETGDMNGTTIRVIAEHGGISKGLIYQHFDSKEQLFYEAVVEPLQNAVDQFVAASEVVHRDEPLVRERQLEMLRRLYRQLVSTLEEVLPLLGLVLFGDPQVGRRLYTESFLVAMDRLAAAWSKVETRHGVTTETDISARVVMGTALVLALESHHGGKQFDLDRALVQATETTIRGFFPSPVTTRRPR